MEINTFNKNINLNANIGALGGNEIANKYYGAFGKLPQLINIQDSFKVDEVSQYLETKGFEKTRHIYYNSWKDKRPYVVAAHINKKKELYILVDESNLYIMYDKSNPYSYMDEFSHKKYRKEIKHAKELCIIVPDQGSYRTSYHTLKRTEFIENNYNTDFIPVHESIVKNLNKDRSGLYLFYGQPGTGKSSYIASLTQMKINKKFIYLPSSLFTQLDSPVLMQLFLNNRNSIFIIEDGEKLLVNREVEEHSPISALLNMSDGLIGQLLNSQIICTFNTSLDKIDNALLRNGRLISMYEFTALEKDRAIELAKMIKKPHSHIKTATTLADVYNQTPTTTKEFKPSRKAIGFKKD